MHSHNIPRQKHVVLLSFILCTLLGFGPVSAAVLEEIIVTAQKREQNLQDVGISVTAFTGDQLSKLGMITPVDLAAQTPGLTFSQEHPGANTQLTIRGISQRDFADHHEPPVAFYVDGAYVGSMGAVNAQMYDVERVEVLRGPQGTLFGRNSTGGLVHIINKKPTEDFDLYGELTVAEYQQIKFEGAVGGKISDRVLGRLSVATDYSDGWFENRIGKDLMDVGTYSVRGQLLFKLTDDTDLLLKVYNVEDDSAGSSYTHTPNAYGPDGLGYRVPRDQLATYFDFAGNPFQTCVGCDGYGYIDPDTNPRTGSINETGHYDRSMTGATGTLTAGLGDVTLTSVTDYLEMDKSLVEDIDGSPLPSIDFFYKQDFKQFSQELRLNGETGRLNWIAGVYFLDINVESASGLPSFNIAPFLGIHAPGVVIPYTTSFTAETDTRSWAVFGHTEYAINDQWSVIAALRYTDDRKEADYVLSDNGFPAVHQEFNKRTAPNAVLKFENVSAKLELDWKPNDSTLLYASYDRGHKAGSFNYPFIGPVNFAELSHDQEEVNAYEVGYKGELLDGRVRLNADVFYYDYINYQASFFVNFVNVVGNLDAEILGSEIELTMQPTDQLELLLGVALLDTKSKDVGMPDGSIQDRGMANAPDVTVNGLARYTIPLGSGANVALQVDFNYSDKFCFSVVCNPSERESSYTVANARASYTTADQRWTFTAFVRNLSNATYRVYSTDSAFATFMTSTPNPPRWYGGTVSFHWN